MEGGFFSSKDEVKATFEGIPYFPPARIEQLYADTPAVFHNKELVTDTARCRQLVHQLKRELIIGVAGEGIRLGGDGPLTLIQVGTFYGKVFIFDVLVNRELFDKGGLRQIFEADNILKVAHSCCMLSAALYFQFGVRLYNVFDTQIAHHLLEEKKGRRLPNRLTLSDVCIMYSDNPYPYDWRSDVKEMWMARIGDFWAKRPLSDEMIEFAAADTMAIIPDVFRNQQEHLEAQGLMKQFKVLVEEEILLETNQVIKQIKGARIEKLVLGLLKEIDEKYDEKDKLFEALNGDEINAMQLVPFEEVEKLSPKLVKFKLELITDELEDIETDIRLQQDIVRAKPMLDDDLRNYELHSDETIREKAKEVREKLYEAILLEIGSRYEGLTSAQVLSETERQALRSMNPESETDDRFDPMVLALHWMVIDYDIDQALFNLKYGFEEFNVSDDLKARVESYISGSVKVSDGLLQKSKMFLKILHRGIPERKVKRPSDTFILNKERRVTFDMLESGH